MDKQYADKRQNIGPDGVQGFDFDRLTVAVFYLVFSRSDVPSFDVFLTRFSAKLFFVVIALSVVASSPFGLAA